MSIKVHQVPMERKRSRETAQCRNEKPVNLLVNESRGTGKGDIVVLKSDLAFVPWPPLALNVTSYNSS